MVTFEQMNVSFLNSTNFLFFFFLEDLKRLNDRLVEVNAERMQLQLKLDGSEASEISIKVRLKKI